MKPIAGGQFKNVCLKVLEEVAATKTTVVITKRGRPVARLVPYVPPAKRGGLAGSVLKEVGDPFGTVTVAKLMALKNDVDIGGHIEDAPDDLTIFRRRRPTKHDPR
jgi:antitoxin (DNA-binding transcriptional repressor) of toxin-antitoxin stability system